MGLDARKKWPRAMEFPEADLSKNHECAGEPTLPIRSGCSLVHPMKTRLALLSTVLVFTSFGPATAGEGSFGFDTAALPEGWTATKGDFKVVDGALVGAELPSDKHAAVLAIPDPHLNSSLSFKVKVDGAKGLSLSYNHAKGHLFRVNFDQAGLALMLDKDKKDPASKSEVLAKNEIKPVAGQWVELTCKVEGDKVVVTCGSVTLEASNPKLAVEKDGYRFVVKGESISFDDVVFSSTK